MASEQDPQQQPQPSAAAPAPASAPEAEQAQKLYDDPVTGEKISKTELKRRAKQREKAQAKAQTKTQTVAKAPRAAAGTTAGDDAQPEEELNPNVGIFSVVVFSILDSRFSHGVQLLASLCEIPRLFCLAHG